MAPGLFGPEHPLDHAPQVVHDAVEHFRRLPPVGLVAVFRVLPLLDVRNHAHPEQLLAVVVRVVSPVGVEEASGHVESVPPDFTQHGRKLDRVVDAARRADGGQYDLQPQDRGDVVLPVYLLAGHDEVALLLVGPLRHPVPGRLHAAAVGRQRAGRVPDLLQAEAGRLGQYKLQPLFGDGLGVPDQGGVDGNRLVVLGRPHALHVRHGAAVGIVVGHHDEQEKVQIFPGVNGRAAPLALLWARARML